MTEYFNKILVTAIACQVSLTLTWDEQSKKYVRLLCAILLLITLISPVKEFVSSVTDIKDTVIDFFTTDEKSDGEESGAETDLDPKHTLAMTLMELARERYGVNEKGLRVSLLTEDDVVEEVHFFVKNCPYAVREKIKTELSDELGVVVYVFSE